MEGYDVTFASDGKSAWGGLSPEGFDLVVTDLHTGRVNGFGVVRRAKELNPTTKVYVMTADRTPSVAFESLQHGADDCLVEPFDLKELAQGVSSLHIHSDFQCQGVDPNQLKELRPLQISLQLRI